MTKIYVEKESLDARGLTADDLVIPVEVAAADDLREVMAQQDGVYAALANASDAEAIAARMEEFSFYVLGPDISARGLSDTPLIEGINAVDHEGFVDLVVEKDVTQSWL